MAVTGAFTAGTLAILGPFPARSRLVRAKGVVGGSGNAGEFWLSLRTCMNLPQQSVDSEVVNARSLFQRYSGVTGSTLAGGYISFTAAPPVYWDGAQEVIGSWSEAFDLFLDEVLDRDAYVIGLLEAITGSPSTGYLSLDVRPPA